MSSAWLTVTPLKKLSILILYANKPDWRLRALSDLLALDESVSGGSVRGRWKRSRQESWHRPCSIMPHVPSSHLILLAEGLSIDRPPQTTHPIVQRWKFWLFFHQKSNFYLRTLVFEFDEDLGRLFWEDGATFQLFALWVKRLYRLITNIIYYISGWPY